MSNAIKISLCMIVKNEAAFLGDCLDSFRDAVDEMIVVDTGSSDETREIAERAGAQVFHFQWCDDFAAARNESLRLAHGDWVLWMDADERLVPGGAQVLRETIARDDFDFGYLAMHDARHLDSSPDDVVSGRSRAGEPYLLPRLLRRLPDLRFEGVVHENVNWWIASHQRVRVLDTAAIHLGYVPEIRKDRDKDRRNLKLLQTRAELEPDNATVHGFLAQEYLVLGEVDKARDAAEIGWAVSEANPDAFSYSLRLAMVRAQLQLKDGAPEDALRTVVRAEQHVGAHPDLHLFGGIVLLRLALESDRPDVRRDRLDGAGEAFQAAQDLGDQVFAERCMGRSANVLGLAGLGTVAVLRGRPEDALVCFEKALEEDPGNLDVELSRAEALVAAGRAPEALKVVEPRLRDTPDAWLVGAAAAEALGDIETFSVLLNRASQIAESREFSAPHRKEIQAGMLARASAYAGEPLPGPGATGAVCALLVGARPERPSVDIDDCERNEIQLLIRNLVGLGRSELLEKLGKSRADRMLPGIHSVMRATVPGVAVGSKKRSSRAREKTPALAR